MSQIRVTIYLFILLPVYLATCFIMTPLQTITTLSEYRNGKARRSS